MILICSQVRERPQINTPARSSIPRDSDINLPVITNTEDRPSERSLRITQVRRARYATMDILVRTPEEIARRLTETIRAAGVNFDVTADGKRFMMAQHITDSEPSTITVVQNWYPEFEDKQL